MKVIWLLCFVLIFQVCCLGQVSDAQVVPADSTYDYSDETTELEDSRAAPDTSRIEVRNFTDARLKGLKADNSLQYKEAPTIAESLWDRFLALLEQFFDSLFRNAMTTDWGRVFSIALGMVLLVVLIMMILKVNAFKVFYRGEGASTMPYNVLDENIHEMDFDQLIQEAIAQHDYRKAVRLLFLKSLKMLADKHYIHWEQGKTNHDYLLELSATDLKKGFHELNYYFEYAWYGNFSVTHETFLKIQHVFKVWRDNVK